MAKDPKDALKGNALSSLMGGGPPPGPKGKPGPARPSRKSDEESPRRTEPRRERPAASAQSEGRGDAEGRGGGVPSSPPRRARSDGGRERRGSGQRVDPRYVGASTYERKGRGEVKKVAFYLSPEVAEALREAGFRGTEHGENMSEIVETLLRENGYGG